MLHNAVNTHGTVEIVTPIRDEVTGLTKSAVKTSVSAAEAPTFKVLGAITAMHEMIGQALCHISFK
jgi:hypothetical protein